VAAVASCVTCVLCGSLWLVVLLVARGTGGWWWAGAASNEVSIAVRILTGGSCLFSCLGSEHVLRVAVVVAVALEALADTAGGVAGTTVGALGDVLVGRASDGLAVMW